MVRAIIKLEIGIVRHFWEGGENAVWRASSKLPVDIVRKLKDDYPLLMVNRPASGRYGAFEAAFDYRDEVDKFGRPAPAFAAAFFSHADDSTRLPAVRDFVFPLAAASVLDLSFEHALPAGQKPPRTLAARPQPAEVEPEGGVSRRKWPPFVVLGAASIALIVALGVLAYFFVGGDGEEPANDDPRPVTIRESESIAPIGSNANAVADACTQLREAADRAPANCATQFARAYCAAPENTAASWESARALRGGYCGAYAHLSPPTFQNALSSDLNAEGMSSFLRDALRQSLFELPAATERAGAQQLTAGGRERPLPVAESQPRERGSLVDEALDRVNRGPRAAASESNAALARAWNAAIADRWTRHRMAADADAAAIVRAYISDYCATTRAVDTLAQAYDAIGFDDPLVATVQTGMTRAHNATVPAARCSGEIAPTLAGISAVTGVATANAAVTALVTTVDFCTLAPWSTLHERGVSSLVRTCQDGALTLGVSWPEARNGRR